jgi:hypothetical protein
MRRKDVIDQGYTKNTATNMTFMSYTTTNTVLIKKYHMFVTIPGSGA